MTKNVMTYEGLKELEKELEHLKLVTRHEVVDRIREAREQGDLSENAEYDAARDEQRDIEARIKEIEDILNDTEVFMAEDAGQGKIDIGSVFTLLDIEYDEEVSYKLVGAAEANSSEGKISNESPVGKAVRGKKAGDVIEVETQVGILKYKIVSVG